MKGEDLDCPLCSSNNISTSCENHKFDFRVGNETHTIEALIPIRRCKTCSFEFLDDEAEAAKESAINNHLMAKGGQDVHRNDEG